MPFDESKAKEAGGGGGGGDYNTWKPESPGDKIEGVYIKRETNKGLKKNSNIYTLRTEDGTERQVWGGAVLNGKFDGGTDQEGNEVPPITLNAEVQITFLGWEKEGQPGAYRNFKVLWIEPADKDKPVSADDVDKLFPGSKEEDAPAEEPAK